MARKKSNQTPSLFDLGESELHTIENGSFLTEQLITYIGNKRALLNFIGESVNLVKNRLGKEKLDLLDIFSGSGVVSRYLKQHANRLISNDLEGYCYTINKCFLSNKSEIDNVEVQKHIDNINNHFKNNPRKGFITKLYSPKNEEDIKHGERVFYTPRNAMYIDTARQLIEEIPKEIRHFILGPLITEASVHNNTSGVFKGFYKNSETGIGQFGGNNKDALKRIKGEIELRKPVLSNFECNVEIFREDANKLVHLIDEVDLVYMDPPYNQHPYGSNYFMLNLINDYVEPSSVSSVSGIPSDWNRSSYNKAKEAYDALLDLCKNVKAKYILISFNSEGYIKTEQMLELLSEIGKVEVMETKYNTFRGSRNLRNRDIHVKEYLYLVEKGVH
jgi:adenine-specific DNA-methyltransferase